VFDGVGVESEQLTAQHKRVASAEGVLSVDLALSQHFIIFSFGECKGVPETTPPTNAKSTKSMRNLLIMKNSITQSINIAVTFVTYFTNAFD